MGRIALLIVMVVSAFGCSAMTELKPGRCESQSNCRPDQRCNADKICEDVDSGFSDTLISQPDSPVAPPDTSVTVDGGVTKDVPAVEDAEEADAAIGDTPIIGCRNASDCPGARSLCVASVCVECASGEDCKDPGKAFCVGGTCVGCEQAGTSACPGKVCAPADAPDAGGQCVECVSSVNCTAKTPVCVGNSCVACTSSEQCAAKSKATPACLASAGTCVPCVSTSDCQGPNLVCDTQNNLCVGCTSSAGCGDATPICTGGACVKCATNKQCSDRDTAKPFCDQASGGCVQCSGDGDCGGKYCEPKTKICVGCVTHANCSGATPLCDGNVCKSCSTATKTCKDKDPKVPACAGGGSCVECTASDTAACTGKKALCNDKTNLCVQCLSNSDCGDTTPICDLKTNACVACASPTECQAKDPKKPACLTSGACEQCKDDTNCQGMTGTTACNTTSHTCVQCVNDDKCTGTTPICDTSKNTCGKCASGDQCQAKSTDATVCLSSGACVECKDNTTCSGTRPICDTSNVCRKCDYKNDNECAGIGPGVCMPDGHCATDAETLSVTTGESFPTLATLTGKSLLVITGTVTGSLSLDFTLAGRSQPLTIAGKSSGTISGGGNLVTIYISGGEAFIKNLAISNGGATGLRVDKSNTLHLEHVTVQNNQGTGIWIDASHFDISNTTVTSNAVSGGSGIQLTSLSTVTTAPKSISNTTVTGNSSGVVCNATADAPSPSPTSVLVYSNGGGGEIAANCKFTTCGTSASAKSATCGAP